MGASTSKQVQKFQDTLRNEISMTADATANCNAAQQIDVKFESMDGCTFDAQNQCIAGTQIDINQMSEAIKNVAQKLSAENSNSDIVLGQASTSIQETETLKETINEITTKCKADSQSAVNQDGKLELGACKNSAVVLVNAADAGANCVLASVQRELYTFQQEQDAQNKNIGVDPAELVASGMISLVPGLACCALLFVGMSGGEE